MSKMNTSNFSLTQAVPERIDLRLGSRTANDARIEGALIEQQHLLGVGPKKSNHDGKGPVKELTAASALTSLVNKPHLSGGDGEDEEDFEIPQRFTKSGRKKATPFPMKVGCECAAHFVAVFSRKTKIRWFVSSQTISFTLPTTAFFCDCPVVIIHCPLPSFVHACNTH